MKAAVFYGPPWPERPMKIEDVPIPNIGPRDVLVKVAACGLCRTDLEYLEGKVRPLKLPPLILGHEISGVVEDVGEFVKEVKKGDRVVICYTIPCEQCFACKSGRQNLCLNGDVLGSSRDGGFAEYVSVPAKVVFKIPQEIPLQEAAVIADAVATAYNAVVNEAQVKPGDKVVIFGASGGLGLSAVQISNALGAMVIGVARSKEKLKKAQELGATHIISTIEVTNIEKEIKDITGSGADVAIDATGSPEVFPIACRSVRPGGKVVVMGFGPTRLELPGLRFVWYGLNIIGSPRYRPQDLPRVIEMTRRGYVKIRELVSHRFKLEELNEGYRMLAEGRVLRAIAIP
jgi:2-desacetyl-2-hydroxyethyl bacteriochlorophyllide A dehydrogenase